MANRARRLTVGTDPVQVTGEVDWRPNQRFLIRPSGGDIRIGGPDVDLTDGFPISDGDAFDDLPDEPVFAVAASDVTVYVYLGGVR